MAQPGPAPQPDGEAPTMAGAAGAACLAPASPSRGDLGAGGRREGRAQAPGVTGPGGGVRARARAQGPGEAVAGEGAGGARGRARGRAEGGCGHLAERGELAAVGAVGPARGFCPWGGEK